MLGVCSWSLRPASPADLVEGVAGVGVEAVQLALDPLRTGAWSTDETVDRLEDAGVRVLSGMMGMRGEDYATLASIRATGGVRPDATWPANRAAAVENARLARRLGLGLVTFHAGFLPHARSDPERARMVDRLRELVDVFDAEGVAVGLETGQETADTLLDVLAQLDRPSAGVNFDPANMVLYGTGDPVESLRRLLPHVLQVHVKDALPAARAGEWGKEVPVGAGAVDWDGFCAALRDAGRPIDAVIEREAGRNRVRDARRAREHLAGRLPGDPAEARR